MGKKRRTFTDQFKAKVGLEAVKDMKTIAELAAQYQVHPAQLTKELFLQQVEQHLAKQPNFP